jgi:hypothetical protein
VREDGAARTVPLRYPAMRPAIIAILELTSLKQYFEEFQFLTVTRAKIRSASVGFGVLPRSSIPLHVSKCLKKTSTYKCRYHQAVLSRNLISQRTIGQGPEPSTQLQYRYNPSCESRIAVDVGEMSSKTLATEEIGQHALIGSIEKGARYRQYRKPD